jgi:hypothetical protein
MELKKAAKESGVKRVDDLHGPITSEPHRARKRVRGDPDRLAINVDRVLADPSHGDFSAALNVFAAESRFVQGKAVSEATEVFYQCAELIPRLRMASCDLYPTLEVQSGNARRTDVKLFHKGSDSPVAVVIWEHKSARGLRSSTDVTKGLEQLRDGLRSNTTAVVGVLGFGFDRFLVGLSTEDGADVWVKEHSNLFEALNDGFTRQSSKKLDGYEQRTMDSLVEYKFAQI